MTEAWWNFAHSIENPLVEVVSVVIVSILITALFYI
jgi:hypothetical protein